MPSKKAVICGCNYAGSQISLKGCVNDAVFWRKTLTEKFGFDAADVKLLVDEGDHEGDVEAPTKENIHKSLEWLTSGAASGDLLCFVFAGHGTQIPDLSGDEADNKDEVLVCADYVSDHSGLILDDELRASLLSVPSGCEVVCVLDCCHSGTALDLKNLLDPTADPVSIKHIEDGNKAYRRSLKEAGYHLTYEPLDECYPRAIPPLDERPENVAQRSEGAQSAEDKGVRAVCFSAARDDQTALDTPSEGGYGGAMSVCFGKAMESLGQDFTYKQLFQEAVKESVQMRETNPRLTQHFQLAYDGISDPETAKAFVVRVAEVEPEVTQEQEAPAHPPAAPAPAVHVPGYGQPPPHPALPAGAGAAPPISQLYSYAPMGVASGGMPPLSASQMAALGPYPSYHPYGAPYPAPVQGVPRPRPVFACGPCAPPARPTFQQPPATVKQGEGEGGWQSWFSWMMPKKPTAAAAPPMAARASIASVAARGSVFSVTSEAQQQLLQVPQMQQVQQVQQMPQGGGMVPVPITQAQQVGATGAVQVHPMQMSGLQMSGMSAYPAGAYPYPPPTMAARAAARPAGGQACGVPMPAWRPAWPRC
ncbi:unnamed protein product [Vitrella brassicaformis CCMP3155]|uniref:Peptidase C14 caspase domain-containing protein n=1 Tax=Vitrella brassicaformis (strain CCMP3155) TaxID=1169540 RepID=A0A0G4FCM7_VITBC|nr:unnamed protein product [Vitrella brassicaformis CCMP3155]|eukprot:CEM10344.1 unnamed protein product [Vitrella brassicaformis CCMP3155]